MSNQPFERIPVYARQLSPTTQDDPMGRFKAETDNLQFRPSFFTWLNIFLLVLAYPAIQLLGAGETTTQLLQNMNQGTLVFVLVSTILFLWVIFLINYAGAFIEGTGLAGLGLCRVQKVDFAWAGAFLLAANLIMAGLTWLLGQVGLPVPGEIGLLIPTEPFGKVIWVVVSFTAGFCEEVAFRGYLMTRIRLLGKFKSWLVPIAVSSVAFGICHAYQGLPGFILILVYGLLLSLMYVRTGRLWPCIIAHFFQDFGALFFPQ